MGCLHWVAFGLLTLVCLWCGRTDGRSVYGHVITKFLGWVDYHISLAPLLKFVCVTSQLRHCLVVHALLRNILDPPLKFMWEWTYLAASKVFFTCTYHLWLNYFMRRCRQWHFSRFAEIFFISKKKRQAFPPHPLWTVLFCNSKTTFKKQQTTQLWMEELREGSGPF